MAHGRILSKDICQDKKVHELSGDLCRLAFSWAITHLDRDGRMPGEPSVVRSWVFPRREDVSTEQMAAFIQEWHDKKLALWYEVDGERYLFFPRFRKHQPGLPYNREPESRISPPPDALLEEFLQSAGGLPAEEKRSEEKRSEDTGDGTPPPSPPVGKKVYGEDVTLTPEQHATLVARYGPGVVSRAIEKLSDYKLAKGKRYKSDYHALKQWVFEAIGAKPKAAPAGWKCPKCGRWNNHSGSGCLDPKCDGVPGGKSDGT